MMVEGYKSLMILSIKFNNSKLLMIIKGEVMLNKNRD